MPVAKRKPDDNKKHSAQGRWLSLRCTFPMGCVVLGELTVGSFYQDASPKTSSAALFPMQ